MVNRLPILYVAGVSITENPNDVPPKTLHFIKVCDFVIGEERKNVFQILKTAEAENKTFYLINEHSNDSDRKLVLEELMKIDSAVFFSDSGTPCISDPDYKLISMAKKMGIIIKSLPGASSVTTALSVSGIDASSFFFAGFPPRDKEKRKLFFSKLDKALHTTIFMERPYSLKQTLSDLSFIKRKISLSINLGNDNETNYFDTPSNLLLQIPAIKAPFVVVVPKS